ncbi:MAG TPA: M64 family metallopeptidase [Actinomycetota bacterium]|nr:M64 family metallopeptidase [Actinomycetota bacterium]
MTTADGSILGVTQIVDNGAPRWDLVILSDGYQASQMTQYAADVQRFVDTMFRTPPFDELRRAINVHRVDVTSTDSGADDPVACGGSGATARTFFDATFCGGGIQRLLVVDNATALSTAGAQVPQWDVVLVLVNSTIYGGAGGAVATFSLAAGAEQIALHELGHTAFGLADEYETLRGCASGETDRNNHPATAELAQANVTINTDRATLKWRHLVRAATRIPTTENANCAQCDPQPSPVPAGTVGLFEGADSYHCDGYRPEFNCMMRTLGSPFCAVCRERISAVLTRHLPEALEDKVVLSDSSGRGPALASHDGRLFLAWRGSGNPQLNLMFSDDNGATFRGKKVFGDTSPHSPALASHGGRLFLSWAGRGNENLHVAKVRFFANTAGGFGIDGLEDKVVLSDSSGRGPALASHDGRLFLAWRGSGNRQLNLMFSDDNGATFRGKKILGETSPHSPALASHGGRLLLSWAGEGDENLNVAKVRFFANTAGGFGIDGLEDKVILSDSSGSGPALASYQRSRCRRLSLAWKGSGNPQLNLMFSDDNGATFRGKRVLGDSSPHSPALASHGGRLLLSWAGEGDENLNVAKVRLSLLTEILWPRRVLASHGGGSPDEDPRRVLGDPNGTVYVVIPGAVTGTVGATFGDFGESRGRYYPRLVELLGASPPVTHNPVRPEDFARADVVAFERNGPGPAPSGGWERCDFVFTDAVTSVSVSVDDSAGAALDPHVLGNGSITGSAYKNYFGVTSGDPIADGEVISFLLFALPELNKDHPNFTVEVRGRAPGETASFTPDIDAIGLLRCADF